MHILQQRTDKSKIGIKEGKGIGREKKIFLFQICAHICYVKFVLFSNLLAMIIEECVLFSLRKEIRTN